ncbi:MAG: diaminopimelate decarboxylase, partial [Alphaproteobacteria bacterium]|nr:diaminopimelate decarboxylase [Alphaproteobacteria bacterium]
RALNEVACSLGQKAPVTIRINPDIDARTHAKITTGTSQSKFGVPWSRARDAYRLAGSLPNLAIVGIDVHIGSQVRQLEPFETAFRKVMELVRVLRADGHSIERLDFGGGLGVPYGQDEPSPPEPRAYADMIARVTKGDGGSLIFEPGRLIAANAGVLVASVIYVKEAQERKFLVIDAGMNDLVRPAMYDARHEIVSVRESASGQGREIYDVVGPVCESSDRFAAGIYLPTLESGDLVAILTAGAYGAVMASAYNARPPAPEVLVKGNLWSVVRPRLDDDALVAADRIPDWL